jgi:hypothetical protein
VQNQKSARNLIDRAALALQASILIRYGNSQVQQLTLLSNSVCNMPRATAERWCIVLWRGLLSNLFRYAPMRKDCW